MAGHDIVAIGASAGGVETLIELVGGLPADLPAAVFIVLHIPAHAVSALPRILGRHCELPVEHPEDGTAIKHGHIYVAPPDYHLLVKPRRIRLTRGPSENGHRPAVDPLFRSAARSYGPRVIGVVLSGALNDGTAGLWTIKSTGGLAVVQDPRDALYSGMPSSAIEHVPVDYILPLAEMPSALAKMVRQPVTEQPNPGENESKIEYETEMAELDEKALEGYHRAGRPSEFGCPACGGVLYELHEGNILRFRCRVGHAYTAETLVAEQSDGLEEALWVALRALEERVALFKRLAENSREHGHDRTADHFQEQVKTTEKHADAVRQLLLNGAGGATAEASTAEESLK
jgi:two-component system, chemotaxis family, protein-glutamate methylesterase/glutaminase